MKGWQNNVELVLLVTFETLRKIFFLPWEPAIMNAWQDHPQQLRRWPMLTWEERCKCAKNRRCH
jgi:hypothetical protein